MTKEEIAPGESIDTDADKKTPPPAPGSIIPPEITPPPPLTFEERRERLQARARASSSGGAKRKSSFNALNNSLPDKITKDEIAPGKSVDTNADKKTPPPVATGSIIPPAIAAPPQPTLKERRERLKARVRVPDERKKATHVGKANLQRDVCIFVGIMSLLFFFSWSTSGVGKKEDSVKNVLAVKDTLKKRMERKLEKERQRKRTTECHLFLAPSSIPGAGFGMFAGKDLVPGESVMDSSVHFAVPLNQDEDLMVSEYSLFIQHHPVLANLRHEGGPAWKTQSSNNSNLVDLSGSPLSFQVTRHVRAGDELFVDFPSHPQSVQSPATSFLFRKVPQWDDYEMADSILRDEIQTLIFKRASMKTKQASDVAVNIAARMVRSSVAKFSPSVANLLPQSGAELHKMHANDAHASLASMRNVTLYKLELDGHCLDDVQVTPSDGVVAKRSIKKGDTLVSSPLYARRGGPISDSCSVAGDETCVEKEEGVGTRSCFGHMESTLVLCPLSPLARMRSGADNPNAEYRWSYWNDAVQKSRNMTVDEVLQEYALRLSFDVVASRDIGPGEEILVAGLKKGSSSDMALMAIPDGLFPAAWKDSVASANS